MADVIIVTETQTEIVEVATQGPPGSGGGGSSDHGGLTGLADDDHTQYLNSGRHSAIGGNPHGTSAADVGAAAAGHGHAQADITGLVAALAVLAPLASPALTGTPTAPTAAGGTNSTQLATTAFVQAAVTALINGAPGALDTLNELAAALGNDANFASTLTTALAGKQPLDADLTSIAALSTTAYGRALLELADAAALRTAVDFTASAHAVAASF